jgi:hypothetical protein
MDQSPPLSESAPLPPGPPAMSLAARLLNVFATPSDVFNDVKTARPATSNWLVPILISGVLGAVAAVLILSQPAIIEQVRAQKTKPIEAKVAAGKMSRAQADQAIEMIEKFSSPAIMQATGAVGAFLGSFIRVFWWALLLWLIGRYCLKAQLDFMKTAELAGLASMITSLEVLMRTLLIFGFNNMLASPSLALLLKNPDPQNKLFVVLSLLDIMTFWVLMVRSIGLAR